MEESARRHADPLDALQAIAETYVTLAADRPHRFRLMFGPEVADKGSHPDVRAAGLARLAHEHLRIGLAPRPA
jgi:hypothetical protein